MSPPEATEKLRAASKNERRCIMRHALGFYRALIITGLYTQHQGNNAFDTASVETYIPALKWCIAAHPILRAAIRGEGSEAPGFVRPTNLNLRNHIQIIEPASIGHATTDELGLLKQITIETHDQLFPDIETIPPWKIIVLPLSEQSGSSKRRVYILFAYSHSHGDGKSGLAFHKTFLEGLESAHHEYDESPMYRTTHSAALLPPLEEVCSLRISWSYLLAPLLGAYLPNFICDWFNLHASATPQTADTWVGKPTSYDPHNFRTGTEIMVLEQDTLNGVLTACKAHGAKFTGLLHQVIVRALSEVLPADTPAGNFIAQTAVDLRKLVPRYSDNDMVNCVSGVYETFPRVDTTSDDDSGTSVEDDEASWNAARKTTTRLADCASTLVDHPVGLLKYLSNFRTWYMNQLGKDRGSSYEISNLGSFDPTTPSQQRKTWDVETVVFSQPANVTSCPINFQVVSRKGGNMVITLNWQIGVLGVVDEDAFIREMGSRIRDSFTAIASSTL